MPVEIKFGTDGWREIIAGAFTIDNVKRVAEATGKYLNELSSVPVCVIGYDCRFGGAMFAEQTALVLAEMGVKCYLSDGFVSTPMVSLACVKLNCHAGVIITASHNPPSYNGYKVKAGYGGPASPIAIEQIEKLVPDICTLNTKSVKEYFSSGKIQMVNLEEMYIQQVKVSFDLDQINRSGLNFAYDAMYGSGQNVIKTLFPNATLLHCDHNPGFEGRAPEPIIKNLPELAELLERTKEYSSGLATDGDADRIGFFDSHGRFVDSHHLILLLIKYLTEYKQLSGKVVKSFSVSSKVEKMCKLKGLVVITTKIGFKYICEYMVTDDVLIGAEESGGIAIKGHIPERDGIWMGLVMWEYMAKSGKTLEELIYEVYDEVGRFYVERYDLHIEEAQKQAIVKACQNREYTAFGNYKVEKVEDTDGFKFHLGNEEWAMIRASGTEPVLRVYAESVDRAGAIAILDSVKTAIGA